jgi:hypothetical protein
MERGNIRYSRKRIRKSETKGINETRIKGRRSEFIELTMKTLNFEIVYTVARRKYCQQHNKAERQFAGSIT